MHFAARLVHLPGGVKRSNKVNRLLQEEKQKKEKRRAVGESDGIGRSECKQTKLQHYCKKHTSWLSNIRIFVAAARVSVVYAAAAHSPMLMRTVSSSEVRKKEKYFVGGFAAATST